MKKFKKPSSTKGCPVLLKMWPFGPHHYVLPIIPKGSTKFDHDNQEFGAWLRVDQKKKKKKRKAPLLFSILVEADGGINSIDNFKPQEFQSLARRCLFTSQDNDRKKDDYSRSVERCSLT